MNLSWSQASGLLATSYSISQSKKLYFSLGFRFSEISAVPFVLRSANQKNRFFPVSQSLYWRAPADQKASGLWVRDWCDCQALYNPQLTANLPCWFIKHVSFSFPNKYMHGAVMEIR